MPLNCKNYKSLVDYLLCMFYFGPNKYNFKLKAIYTNQQHGAKKNGQINKQIHDHYYILSTTEEVIKQKT